MRQGQPQWEGILDTNISHDASAFYKDDCFSKSGLHVFISMLKKKKKGMYNGIKRPHKT